MQRRLLLAMLCVGLVDAVFVSCVQVASGPAGPAVQTPSPASGGSHRAYAYAGLPKPTGVMIFKLLSNIGYLAGYSEQRKDPLWVAYRVSKVAAPQTHRIRTADPPQAVTIPCGLPHGRLRD